MVDDMDHQRIIEERKQEAERRRYNEKKTSEDINVWARLKEIKTIKSAQLDIFIGDIKTKGLKVERKGTWLRVINQNGDRHSIKIEGKTQAKIVAEAFKTHPGKVFTAKSMSKLTSIEKSSVYPTPSQLVKLGVIKRVGTGEYKLVHKKSKKEIEKKESIPKKVDLGWMQIINVLRPVFLNFDNFTLQVNRDNNKLVMILEAPL